MSRFKAFSIHFLISALVVGTFLGLAVFLWYPSLYFEISGTRRVLMMLVIVDMVLGPLMTLIVFRSGKPGLKTDLSIIAGIQIIAFLYGTSVIVGERPGYVVFSVDRFEIIASNVDFSESHHPELEAGLLTGPVFVYAELPEDGGESSNLLWDSITGGSDLAELPRYYQPYENGINEILAKGRPATNLIEAGAVEEIKLRNIVGDIDFNDVLYVPIVGKSKTMSVIIHPESAMPLGMVDAELW